MNQDEISRLLQLRQAQMQQSMQAHRDWVAQQRAQAMNYSYMNLANLAPFTSRDLYIAGARYDGMTGQLKRRTP